MAEFFRRVEKKYIINEEQYKKIKRYLVKSFIEDEHGKSTICNIYFDNDNYDLIRHSISKPIFKEKIRLRSYNTPNLYSGEFIITGGTLIAYGSSGMLQAPTSSSSQNTIIYKLSGNIGDIITLKNNEEIEIISFETEKNILQ